MIRGPSKLVLASPSDGRGVLLLQSSRKVRTPQGRVLDNFQAGRPDGKCSREQTAKAVGTADGRQG